jgi:hypothetical protein
MIFYRDLSLKYVYFFHKVIMVLEQPAVTCISPEYQLGIWNILMQIIRATGQYHSVVIAVEDEGCCLDRLNG